MSGADIAEIIDRQRLFFGSGRTRDVSYRIGQLKRLKNVIQDNEDEIFRAIHADMKKSKEEIFLGEIAGLTAEIDHAVRHVRSWSKPERVGTPFALFPGSSFIIPEPLGVVLIMGPWNYPFQLVLAPLVGALAAGNCAVLKPSELTPDTSWLVRRLIAENFEPGLISVVEGGPEVATDLLGYKFDHVFFTGGTEIGRIVAQAAAKTLTPVTLELGGKSPCIVDGQVDVDCAARRIVWGKFFNAGQTCVAPDYLLVDGRIKEDLLAAMRRCVIEFYGENPEESPDYCRIVNKRHFDRLSRLLDEGDIVVGGQTDPSDNYIAPTIINNVAMHHKIMESEIFGPILPVLEYVELTQAISIVNSRPKPLALYFFSKSRKNADRVLRETSSGGGAINDTIIHVSSHTLPFGGVGDSGIGRYHGKAGFDAFTNKRAIVKRPFVLDASFRYPPYRGKLPLLRRLMRYFG